MTKMRLDWGQSTRMEFSVNEVYHRKRADGTEYYELQYNNVNSNLKMSFYPQSGQLYMFAPGESPPFGPGTRLLNKMVLPQSATDDLERQIKNMKNFKDLR